jgi:alpha/beta superfamily hydrolase
MEIAKAIVVGCIALAAAPGAAQDTALETSVCGSFKEPVTFALWRGAAGQPNPERASRAGGVPIEFTTKDRRILRGYKLPAEGERRGIVLFAQGNAMLADQPLQALRILSSAGLEVHVYDFRGYGNSEGTSRLKAIQSDYEDIARSLASYGVPLYLYGTSFGGILMMNVVGAGVPVTRAVIDSSPSTVSDMGCPASYDPVGKVPAAADMILVIAGDQDGVVPVSRSVELARRVESLGGRYIRDSEFGHPFMDRDPAVSKRRLEIVRDFLTASPRSSP